MAATTITKNDALPVLILLLLLLALAALPPALSSHAGPPSPHKSHGHGTKHHPSSPSPSQPPAAPQAPPLVRATCNSTANYELCVSALGADPSSATADVRGLSAIAISVAAANANGTAPLAAADTIVRALLRTCADKYGSARDALGAARDSITVQDYDFASVQVSAAAEYPQVCRTLSLA